MRKRILYLAVASIATQIDAGGDIAKKEVMRTPDHAVSNAFKEGSISGQIRLGYIDQDNAIDPDTYTAALGGILKYETGAWSGFNFGLGAYISQKIPFATGDGEEENIDFLTDEGDSYAYVGEAYINYAIENLNIRLGRQLIDTPFADTDDIRMHPNSFEAAIASYTGFEKTTLMGGYVTRWAGFDSGENISEFKKLVYGGDGAFVIGAVNESIENLHLQGWYYSIDGLSDALYADAAYTVTFSETMGLELSGQFADFAQKSDSGLDGNVYGIGASVNVAMATIGASYNDVSGVVSNGFGGGPYLTCMEEMTIDGVEDVEAYRIAIDFDMEKIGLAGLTLSATYGNFKNSLPDNIEIEEVDIAAAYEIDKITAEMSYAMIDDANKNTLADDQDMPYDGGYDRFLARLTYNF